MDDFTKYQKERSAELEYLKSVPESFNADSTPVKMLSIAINTEIGNAIPAEAHKV